MPAGGRNNTQTNTKSFLNVLLSRLPYTYRILDDISNLNPKYEEFHELTTRKDERIAQQSVVVSGDKDNVTNSAIMINKDYHAYMYSNIDTHKVRRLQQYRRMAA